MDWSPSRPLPAVNRTLTMGPLPNNLPDFFCVRAAPHDRWASTFPDSTSARLTPLIAARLPASASPAEPSAHKSVIVAPLVPCQSLQWQ